MPERETTQRIMMRYGPHQYLRDFEEAKRILSKELPKLKQRSKEIISIIEYAGPPHFNRSPAYVVVSDELLREKFITHKQEIEKSWTQFRRTGKSNLGNPFFDNLCEYLADNSVKLFLEDAQPNDYIKFVQKFKLKGETDYRPRDNNFIKQIKKASEENPSSSSIIVRGDHHKYLFTHLKREGFDVHTREFGE